MKFKRLPARWFARGDPVTVARFDFQQDLDVDRKNNIAEGKV